MKGPPPGGRATRSILSAVAPLVVVAMIVASCSDDGDQANAPSSSSSSSTTSTSTTTTEPTTSSSAPPEDDAAALEAEITDRYLAFWDARFEANTEPVNPDDPRLAEFATGAQLDNVVEETRQRVDAGLALRRPEDSVTERRPRVVELDGDEATIQDCAINDSIVYRVATGEVIDDSIVTRSVSATMRLVDGEWRLEGTRELQKWEGVAGCALASDS